MAVMPLCTAWVALLAGCPGAITPDIPPDGSNDTGTQPAADSNVQAQIDNFRSDFEMSEDDPAVSVIYTVTGVPDSVRGFYVSVLESEPQDRIATPEELPAGTRQQFLFDPSVAGVGLYRVGIIVTVAGEEPIIAESTGTIRVKGRPNPLFIQPPIDSVTQVSVGEEIAVRFDVGDPEDDARWRLFYITADDPATDPPASLGTELRTGAGNLCEDCTFPTEGLVAGEYQLGLSATDSGQSVAAAPESRVITVFGPTVKVIEQEGTTPP